MVDMEGRVGRGSVWKVHVCVGAVCQIPDAYWVVHLTPSGWRASQLSVPCWSASCAHINAVRQTRCSSSGSMRRRMQLGLRANHWTLVLTQPLTSKYSGTSRSSCTAAGLPSCSAPISSITCKCRIISCDSIPAALHESPFALLQVGPQYTGSVVRFPCSYIPVSAQAARMQAGRAWQQRHDDNASLVFAGPSLSRSQPLP